MKVTYKDYGRELKNELSTYVWENLQSDGYGGELENIKDEITKLRSLLSTILDHMCEKDPILVGIIGVHFNDFDLKQIGE